MSLHKPGEAERDRLSALQDAVVVVVRVEPRPDDRARLREQAASVSHSVAAGVCHRRWKRCRPSSCRTCREKSMSWRLQLLIDIRYVTQDASASCIVKCFLKDLHYRQPTKQRAQQHQSSLCRSAPIVASQQKPAPNGMGGQTRARNGHAPQRIESRQRLVHVVRENAVRNCGLADLLDGGDLGLE